MSRREEMREIVVDVVRQAPESLVPARGVSMGRRFLGSSHLLVRGIAHVRPMLGDVVLFRRGGTWVAHRVAWVRGKGDERRLLTRGDANALFDAPWVSPDDLLGVVHGRRKNGILLHLSFRDQIIGWVQVMKSWALIAFRACKA